ncbi:MAG TPA: glycosyltransferase family 1 protein [Thermoleophilaceae bacterium]|nr:glycosyltransferase family 1 protein [Thermoleophilaceae bacterium]
MGLNLVFLIPGETGGMETAARETIPQLAAIDDLRLTLFVNREAAGSFGGVAEEVVVPVNATSRIQWVRGEQQHVPRLAARHGCEIVHSLGSTAPLRGAFKRVTTIHDLNYRKVPESHFGLRGLGMRALVPAAARRSHRIIVDAASTRDDLRDLLKIDPSKVDVVPLGVTPPAGEPAPAAELRSTLDLPDGPLVLCPGAKRPHKNAHGVIEAVALMEDRPAVVVTGYSSPYEQRLRELADARGVNLRMPRYLDQAGLDGLYELASCVAVVSFYEGFGLPVLEAMARGVPVVCSDRASLPEVAGDAAVLVNPDDPADIRRGIERALADPEPLREGGLRRAAGFTWERTARLTAETYRRA